jgi:hypothetical protein
MEKVDFRIISGGEEIDLFLEIFERHVGIKLPADYVSNSKIVGAFLHEKLVGGYMLVTSPPFRSTLFVPDSVKKWHSFFENDAYDMMEVNGVWISPALKSAKLQFSVWTQLLMDIFLSKKKYILLMRDARNKNVDHIHKLTSPIQIYKGRPWLTTDQFSHNEVNVCYTTRWKLIFGFHRYWKEYRHRKVREAQRFDRLAYRQIGPSDNHTPS